VVSIFIGGTAISVNRMIAVGSRPFVVAVVNVFHDRSRWCGWGRLLAAN
jgi:hypothetical protein